MIEIAFMVFALGFFTFTVRNVQHQNDTEYARKLNEQREFGYQATSKPNSKAGPPK